MRSSIVINLPYVQSPTIHGYFSIPHVFRPSSQMVDGFNPYSVEVFYEFQQTLHAPFCVKKINSLLWLVFWIVSFIFNNPYYHLSNLKAFTQKFYTNEYLEKQLKNPNFSFYYLNNSILKSKNHSLLDSDELLISLFSSFKLIKIWNVSTILLFMDVFLIQK